VTAAKVAKKLINRGYRNIRPLSGGIDAWRDAGFAITMSEKESLETNSHV
jgi:rhodanese-related sulfurtransferase